MRDKYTVRNLKVSPNDLLLDPLNFRLWSSQSQVENFKDADLSHESIQQKVYGELTRKDIPNAHGIDELAQSINENGFVELATIFVVKYKSKYLVVEGNRRLAATKKLLKSGDITTFAKNSLSKINVTQIVCKAGVNERSVINHIIAIHQFAGPKQWGPMQQAYYVYDTYMNHYKRAGHSNQFSYLNDVAKEAAAELHLATPEVKKMLKISSAYQDIMHRGYLVEVYHYSIISETVKRDKFAEEYFGFDKDKFIFSEDGAERFYSMCLDDADRPVNEPKKVAWIYKLQSKGYDRLLKKVLDRALSLDEANIAMKQAEETYKFSDSLERATKILEDLKPSDFRGEGHEILALKRHLELTENLKIMAKNVGSVKS